jgi:hypothetical protein
MISHQGQHKITRLAPLPPSTQHGSLSYRPYLFFACIGFSVLFTRNHYWLIFILRAFSQPLCLSIHPSGYAVGSLALVADSFHMLKYVPPDSFSFERLLRSSFLAM